MAGPRYTKSSRSTSSSPRLRCNSASKSKYKELGPGQRPSPPEFVSFRSKSCSPQKCSIPLQNGKRRPSPVVSPTPNQSRIESTSPNAKSTSMLTSDVTCGSPQKPLLVGIDETTDGSLAVPKITAMPPKPTFLPRPPTHWVGELGTQCQASKQQCRIVTQCLMSHLSSTGILVSAQ